MRVSPRDGEPDRKGQRDKDQARDPELDDQNPARAASAGDHQVQDEEGDPDPGKQPAASNRA